MRKMLLSVIGCWSSMLARPEVLKCTSLPRRWRRVMMPGRRLSLTNPSMTGLMRCRRGEDMPASSAETTFMFGPLWMGEASSSSRRAGRTGCSGARRAARPARPVALRAFRGPGRTALVLPRQPCRSLSASRRRASAERASASPACPCCSWDGGELDLDVWGRNCDRAVEWSPALEARHQVGALFGRNAAELQVDAHRVEDVDVLPNGRIWILGGLDGGVDRAQRDIELLGEHLDELDAARRHTGQEHFGGRGSLARAAVLDRAVDNEMLIAGADQHPAERVRRSGTGLVPAYLCLGHSPIVAVSPHSRKLTACWRAGRSQVTVF